MRATQKKMMSKPVTQHGGRIVGFAMPGSFPAILRRERPERRGEPGIEHVVVLAQRRGRFDPVRAARSASLCATYQRPSGSYQAGIR